MAIPRVFVSSTCYDLKYIRENLKYFIKTVGYEPVLSDDGDVFYNPSSHTHDACLREVETCQLFVLIIGGRYGGLFKNTENSITNKEFKQALQSNIPVFALVESGVHSDHHLFIENKKNNPEIFEMISYPSSDDIKIFHFLDEVRKNTKNNSLFPFRDFSDIESYLKKQWAGMMFDFLGQRQSDSHARVTNRLLDDLTVATRKSEELIKILLKSSQSPNPEEAIQKVDNQVEAENFARLVLTEFEIHHLEKTNIQDLEKIGFPDRWEEFLLATNEFRIDKSNWKSKNGQSRPIVLWGPGSCGIGVGFLSEKDLETKKERPEFEKSYRALKEADAETRTHVFKMLTEGT